MTGGIFMELMKGVKFGLSVGLFIITIFCFLDAYPFSWNMDNILNIIEGLCALMLSVLLGLECYVATIKQTENEADKGK